MSALSILYVEDSEELRSVMTALLEDDGREVVCCADGEEALATWQSRPFDLVMTDVGLPKLSGTDMARQMLAQKPAQWIVLCSGFRVGTEHTSLGPHVHVLTKPFEFDALDALLEEAARALHGPQA